MKAELNKYPFITISTSSATPATPEAGTSRLFVGSDKKLWLVDSTGAVSAVTGTSTGGTTGGTGTVTSINTVTPAAGGNVSLTADNIPDGANYKTMTTAERSKLSGVAAGATANQTDTYLLTRTNHTGSQSADTIISGATNKVYTATEQAKLAAIQAGATANQTDTYLLSRANHTGTQNADTITSGTANKVYTAAEQTKLASVATGATAYTDAQAKTAVGIPANDAAATLAGDNVFTGENKFPSSSIASSVLSDLDSRFDNYVATKGIPQVRTFANGTTPTVTANTLWLELAAGTTGTAAASLISHTASNLNQASQTFTVTSTMTSADVYIAFVWAGTTVTGTPVAIASTVTGRSLTWTKIGAGINQTLGTTSLVAFKGVGTPSASGDITITFPSAVTGSHLELVAVDNVSTTIAASAYNNTGASSASPTISLAAAPASTAFQLLALGVNATSNTISVDPGTPLGTTADLTSFNPAMASRVSYRTSAQQTSTWTKSAQAQYTAASIVFTPA